MIKFNTYRLLNESLGMYSLGLTPVQSLGIQSNMPGLGEAGAVPAELDAKKGKKPPFGGGDEEGGENPGMAGPVGDGPPAPGGDAPVDDMGGDMEPMGDDMGGDDMGGDDMGGDPIADKIAELEDMLNQLKALVGGGDEGGMDDMDADLDHEDDLGDIEGDEGEEGDHPEPDGDEDADGEEKPELPFKKGKSTPFMSKGMKKEGNEGMSGGNSKDGPVFMMKKAKKCGSGMDDKKVILGKSKKCDSSADGGMMPMKKGKMCKKCTEGKMDKKMHKEATGYERPKAIDNSDEAWMNSIRGQIAKQSTIQKFDDGMRKFTNEDLLLPPPSDLAAVPDATPVQQPVDGDLGFTAEAVQDILSRLARLEGGK